MYLGPNEFEPNVFEGRADRSISLRILSPRICLIEFDKLYIIEKLCIGNPAIVVRIYKCAYS